MAGDQVTGAVGSDPDGVAIGKDIQQASGNRMSVYFRRDDETDEEDHRRRKQHRDSGMMTDGDRLLEKMDDLTEAITALRLEMVSLKHRIITLEAAERGRWVLIVLLTFNAVIMLAGILVVYGLFK